MVVATSLDVAWDAMNALAARAVASGDDDVAAAVAAIRAVDRPFSVNLSPICHSRAADAVIVPPLYDDCRRDDVDVRMSSSDGMRECHFQYRPYCD